MRAVLLLLLACGNREAPAPTPEPSVSPPRCKPGKTICAGDDVRMCEDGSYSRTVTSCRGGCREGACVETCGANDVELIYLVDSGGTLFSFDPRKLPQDPFRKIGPLSCDEYSRPYSMAVDRTGIAWVVYLTGVLYQVSIMDAHCFSSAAKVIGTPGGFGMGFVTDGPGSSVEKLFATSPELDAIGTIDIATTPAVWTRTGALAAADRRAPELSGAGDGKLYAYSPTETQRGSIREIDRTGKGIGKPWKLPTESGQVGGFAFAFWGDVFYVFVTFEDRNEVYAVHRKTGKAELVIPASEHEIVGAGVSTCAPVLERPL